MPALDITQGDFRARRGALDQAYNLHMLMRTYRSFQKKCPSVEIISRMALLISRTARIISQCGIQGMKPDKCNNGLIIHKFLNLLQQSLSMSRI